MFYFLSQFANLQSGLQLDIVGIVAILGEGSVTRNAQASALSWHNLLPRLLPAPQAFIKCDRESRLPTQNGTIVGAYSGNMKHELNFFTNLLHPRPLGQYEVELVSVSKKKDPTTGQEQKKFKKNAFGVDTGTTPWLPCLSIVGCLMAIALLALSVHYDDGFALCADVLLSATSSVVGAASMWKLEFREHEPRLPPKEQETRGKAIPDSDVVIFYPPQGAFRIIRIKEERIARLYFEAENCHYIVRDNGYRILALFATVFLMFGVICLANAKPKLQVSFAAAYILLNILYWATSAMNPLMHHWDHNYEIKEFTVLPPNVAEPQNLHQEANTASSEFEPVPNHRKKTWYRKWIKLRADHTRNTIHEHELRDRLTSRHKSTFTAALWSAIALTGSTNWLNEATHIAPINEAWNKWILEAGKRARLKSVAEVVEQADIMKKRLINGAVEFETNGKQPDIVLPEWLDYNKRLTELLGEYRKKHGKRPSRWPSASTILDLHRVREREAQQVKDGGLPEEDEDQTTYAG